MNVSKIRPKNDKTRMSRIRNEMRLRYCAFGRVKSRKNLQLVKRKVTLRQGSPTQLHTWAAFFRKMSSRAGLRGKRATLGVGKSESALTLKKLSFQQNLSNIREVTGRTSSGPCI